MTREIFITDDGSHSVRIRGTGLMYHSRYGAVQESRHIFLEAGFLPLLDRQPLLRILEVGWGTGLNNLLTLMAAIAHKQAVYYEGLETEPLEPSFSSQLNYGRQLSDPGADRWYRALHACPWEHTKEVGPNFMLRKRKLDLLAYGDNALFHLIYFDVFGPSSQPELWSAAVFSGLFDRLFPGGVLVTYSASGTVRRSMESAGFKVEKLPGPPGKREIVRAFRPDSSGQ